MGSQSVYANTTLGNDNIHQDTGKSGHQTVCCRDSRRCVHAHLDQQKRSLNATATYEDEESIDANR
jgi:hypothetical protein